jgi:hypothetical protein
LEQVFRSRALPWLADMSDFKTARHEAERRGAAGAIAKAFAS